MPTIKESELILNKDGSVYHLNLLPEDLAPIVITVGDPDRVALVSSFFDQVDIRKGKREFITHTGHYKGCRISVVSTGIGTDNIDIVFNELDALVNIDLQNRSIKPNLQALKIIRIGTTGALQKDIPVDRILLNSHAVGLDGLLHYYQGDSVVETAFQESLLEQLTMPQKFAEPYVVACDANLLQHFSGLETSIGTTVTNTGFYGPQSRVLRLALQEENLMEQFQNFQFKSHRITNLEMETSGIYAMAKLLGHQALSINAVVANRHSGSVSENAEKTMRNTIAFALDKISNL